jgi:hypothetical protein
MFSTPTTWRFTLNIISAESTPAIPLPDDSVIASLSFALLPDGALPGADPILVTISMNPTQVDPDHAVDALRLIADELDDAIDAFDGQHAAA